MMNERFPLGEIDALLCENAATPSLVLIPRGTQAQVCAEKTNGAMCLAQVHARGDGHQAPYAKGLTMLDSNTAASMRLESAKMEGDALRIVLKGAHGLRYTQRLTPKGRALLCAAELANDGDAPVTIDHAASFCIGGMTPFEPGVAPDSMRLHRFSSFWSSEGRHQCDTLESLNMETSWSKWAPKTVKIGQYGTMPVRGFFPVMVLEDVRHRVSWGAEVAWAGSWSMELFRRKDDAALCGGLAGYEDGHFRKTLMPGETLPLPGACLTAVQGGAEDACDALLDAHEAQLRVRGEAEDTLEPMYNEYLDTWGKPTLASVRGELKALRGLGLRYFVIDAGWYGSDADWTVSTGDWEVRKSAFPNGMKEIADEIKAEGMIPGIWFEAEVASDSSRVLRDHPEMFVKEGGKPVVETNRAFLNLTRNDAQAYLREKVIDFLRDNGFGYVKIDYNNTYGLGFDGFESHGEAQRNGVLGTYRFFDAMQEELPRLVIENCSSGGHRLEMSMMGRCAMASFSDAHECPEIPLIAADLHRLILPRQSQIWAGIRAEDSIERIIWSMSAALLGRLCLSGQVAQLDEEQMRAVREGVAFYRKAAPIIKEGKTRVFRREITAYDHARGWQAVCRKSGSRALVTAHAFEQNGGEWAVDLGLKGYAVDAVYAPKGCGVSLEDGQAKLTVNGDYRGMGALLSKSE